MTENHSQRSKHYTALFSALALIAIVTVAPHAFALQGPSSFSLDQQNGIPLGPPYGAHPLPVVVSPQVTIMALSAVSVLIGSIAGLGVMTTVRTLKQ